MPSKAEIAAGVQAAITRISPEEIAAYAEANNISTGAAFIALTKQRQNKANITTDKIAGNGKQRTELHGKRRKK